MKCRFFTAGISLLPLAAFAGCSNTVTTFQPPSGSPRSYVKQVPRSKDVVWNDAVAALGQRFFVINNMDKASGLINVSYSGDPTRFVDCGRFTVENTGPGAKTQTIDGAAADAVYEVMVPRPPYGIRGPVLVRRQMSLEGRVNVIFEAVDAESTRVTTATRYVLTRRISPSNAAPHSDNAAFNGNEKGYFPQLGTSQRLECVATGTLEDSILSVIK